MMDFNSIILSFGGNSILFECHYARSISVDEGMTVEPSSDKVVNTGDLSYSMSLTVGALGGNTEVFITRNHNLDQIAPRLVI